MEDMLFKHITKSLMAFEAFVHACHIQFLQPCIVSDTSNILNEELVIAEAGEEFVTVEAFEHSGEELADSRSMHFKHGGTNSS